MSNFIEIVEGEEGWDIGDTRAVDYDNAVAFGLEPQSYSRDIPEGEYIVELKFKTWGKKMALNCFFETVENKKRYRIVAFTGFDNPEKYTARDKIIDFSESGNLQNIYKINIGRTKGGYPKWISAELIAKY